MSKKCFYCNEKINSLTKACAASKDRQFFCYKCLSILFPEGSGIKCSKMQIAMKVGFWTQLHDADYIANCIDNGFQEEIISEVNSLKFKDICNTSTSVNQQPDLRQRKMNKILKQMEEAGVSDTFGTKKEIKALPDILDDDEVIKYATSGFWNNNTVLMICTDQRVIFLNKNMVYGTDRNDIPLNTINAVSYSSKMLFATITITNGANTTVIEQVSKETAEPMVKAIKDAQQNYINGQNVSAQPLDEADQIRKFKSLLDDGIITEEEFEAKKKQILGL